MTTQIQDEAIVHLVLTEQLQYRINEYTRARNQNRQNDFINNMKLAKRILAELDVLHISNREPNHDHLREDSTTNYPRMARGISTV